MIAFNGTWSSLFIYGSILLLDHIASTAGGLRNWIAAVFASFKKYAAHFLNADFIGTEPKKAANPVTGESGRFLSQEAILSKPTQAGTVSKEDKSGNRMPGNWKNKKKSQQPNQIL